MPDVLAAVDTLPPVLAYARLLLELHKLIGAGRGDSEEAEAIAERMDGPWYSMTDLEQARMRGLAADLNALREGSPTRVDMNPEQLAQWRRDAGEAWKHGEANPDAALGFFRRPSPSKVPRHVVPFLQSRYWEKLGDLETALVFMKEAERLDPSQAFSVLILLQHLGRQSEIPAYVQRVVQSPAVPPLEMYVAGVALLSTTRELKDSEAAPTLREAVAILTRALAAYRAMPAREREETPEAEAYLAHALGLCLERLGESRAAIDLYSEALSRNPRNAELYMMRGLALYESDLQRAVADLRVAAQLGVAAIWPYLILARLAIQHRAPAEALRLARIAENQPGHPVGRAEVYEVLGLALSELGQSRERVLDAFDHALALDPNNGRIRENRTIAAAHTSQSRGDRSHRLRPLPPLETDRLRRARSDQLISRTELLNEQLQIQRDRKLGAA